MIPIIERLIPVATQRRSGQKIKGVAFIVSHDTGNDGSTAEQNVSYYIRSANEMQASAHYFVDDKQIICCVPESEKAWHVRYDVETDNELYGKDANDWALGVELCFSSKGTMDNGKAYQNYIQLFASLCSKYNLDPLMQIVGHYRLDPTRRTDPINAFKFIGRTWTQFLQDVHDAMPKPPADPVPVKPATPSPSVASAIHDQIRQKWGEIDQLIAQLHE